MPYCMATRYHTPAQAAPTARVRPSYFEYLYGQLHVHHAIPAGGGFDEATPLLALHAAAQTGRMFGGILLAMGADRSAFAPDLAGFGQSDGPREALTAADHAAAIGDFLDAMRLRQVDVLGCGLGALVAIELALSRPGVRRVVVMPLPPEAGQPDYPLGAQLARIAQPLLFLYPRDMPQALLSAAGNLPVRARRELPGNLSLLETAPETVAEAIKDFLS